MMGQGFGEEVANSMMKAIAVAVAIAFMLGGLVVYVLPKVWNWLIPIIHSATS